MGVVCRAEAASLGPQLVGVTRGHEFRILGYMEQKLCELCDGQEKRENERWSKPHDKLRVTGHVAGGHTMYASNTGEVTTYTCAACKAIWEYSGADRTEAAPFWVQRGWAS